jgi:2-methylcitrate dehydratase PrpD
MKDASMTSTAFARRDRATVDVACAATVSSAYARFIAGLRYEDIPAAVANRTRELVLDLVGVSLAGYKLTAFPRYAIDFCTAMEGVAEASVIQSPRKLPAANAAFANAACGHALDMDDGHRYAALHPGTVVIPAAIAAAEHVGVSSRELIAGIVCGYEVMIRVGMAINPSSLGRGFHSTGTAGPFGACAAVARILGLDHDEIVGAFGMAGLQGSGLLQVNHDEGPGGEAKALNAARAAMAGYVACALAQKGARGPAMIFEGKDGFLQAFADKTKPELLTAGLGERFETVNSYVKFYASGRHSHACIDAALEAFAAAEIGIDDIASIDVETYATAIRFTGITDVRSPAAARFSIAYSIALALATGDAGPNAFTQANVDDPRIQALAASTRVATNERWEAAYPSQRGATVRIRDRAGRECVAEAGLAKGEPERPATRSDILSKFMRNASLQIGDAAARELAEVILDFDRHPVSDLTERLR